MTQSAPSRVIGPAAGRGAFQPAAQPRPRSSVGHEGRPATSCTIGSPRRRSRQNRRYRRLFAAQCLALVGTGLATIALALLAYDLAGPSAGAVLGAALAIKMVLSVVVSPVVDDVVRHTHIHTDAAPHEHLTGAVAVGDPSRAGPSVWVHTHRVVIDDQHPRRPEVVS